jgi:hypothetical protein
VTHPALASEPAPGGKCRVCGAQLPEGSLHCTHCGATYGESNRCPHCRSVTEVEPGGVLRFRCRVCGGPRVPADDPNVVRSGREIPLLATAQKARRRGAAWRVGAGLVAGFGALSVAVALIVWLVASPGLLGTLGMLVMLSAPIVLALLAWRRAGAERRATEHALDQAWALVAADVLASRGAELNAAELARILRIDEANAELLLGQLNVNDFVHARVTDEGDVVYSSRAPEKLRVPSDGGDTQLATPAEALDDAAVSVEGSELKHRR